MAIANAAGSFPAVADAVIADLVAANDEVAFLEEEDVAAFGRLETRICAIAAELQLIVDAAADSRAVGAEQRRELNDSACALRVANWAVVCGSMPGVATLLKTESGPVISLF